MYDLGSLEGTSPLRGDANGEVFYNIRTSTARPMVDLREWDEDQLVGVPMQLLSPLKVRRTIDMVTEGGHEGMLNGERAAPISAA